MTDILDQTSDKNHQELHRLLKTYGVPEFVKQASFDDILSPEDNSLPPRAYALPGYNKYRLDNPAATYVSMAFLMDKKAEMTKNLFEHAFTRLDGAASFHNIQNHTNE